MAEVCIVPKTTKKPDYFNMKLLTNSIKVKDLKALLYFQHQVDHLLFLSLLPRGGNISVAHFKTKGRIHKHFYAIFLRCV